MKPEIYYEGLILDTSMTVALNNIDWQMKQTKISDPYFKQLSIEKYALEQLRARLHENTEIGAFLAIENFVSKMNKAACANKDPDQNFIFSVSRDAVQSILDGIFFE